MAAKTKKKAAHAAPKASGNAPKDAVALLEADHREVEGYFEAYKTAKSGADKKQIAGKICVALRAHAQIEEELFYPAARNATKANDLLDEATVEHAGAKILIAEIEAMQPGMPLYDAKVTVLGERFNIMSKKRKAIFSLRFARRAWIWTLSVRRWPSEKLTFSHCWRIPPSPNPSSQSFMASMPEEL